MDWLGLDKTEVIGDVGGRSFYLRKSNSGHGSDNIVAVRASTPPPPPFLLPGFIACRIGKIVRRIQKFWNVVVCGQ